MAKYLCHKHQFLFKIPDPMRPGKMKLVHSWAKVIAAKKPVMLKLKAEDVERSIEVHGIGSTQTCAMAICALRQAEAFKHPVDGYIDWQYSRAYVVSKLGKNGLPSECVCYEHDDDIAKINDSKDGQQKLLNQLIIHGDRDVLLRPLPIRPSQKGPAKHQGKKDGSRTPSKTLHLRGANLRYAIAQLGGALIQEKETP